MNCPAETFDGRTNVVAIAAAASDDIGENVIDVPDETVGAGTVVDVALAVKVNVPEQFNLP